MSRYHRTPIQSQRSNLGDNRPLAAATDNTPFAFFDKDVLNLRLPTGKHVLTISRRCCFDIAYFFLDVIRVAELRRAHSLIKMAVR
jgi:hypothetical protein